MNVRRGALGWSAASVVARASSESVMSDETHSIVSPRILESRCLPRWHGR